MRNLCFSIFGRESSTRVDTFNEFIHFRLLSRLDVLNAPTHLHNSMKMTCLWAAMSICAVIIVSCSHCYNATAVVVRLRLIGLKLTAARRRLKCEHGNELAKGEKALALMERNDLIRNRLAFTRLFPPFPPLLSALTADL